MDSRKYRAFLKAQIKRLLKTHGSMLTFTRKGVNEFREPSDELVETIEVLGLLHQTQGFISKTSTEGSQIRTEPTSMILVSGKDAARLKTGDFITLGKLSYRITGFNSLDDSEVYSDISLEVYDGWTD